MKLIGSIHFYQGKGGLDSPAARHVRIRNVKHCQTPQIVVLSASGCVTAVFRVLPRWRGCSGVDKGSGSLGSVTGLVFTLDSAYITPIAPLVVTWCQVSRKPFPIPLIRMKIWIDFLNVIICTLETILLIRVFVLYNIFYPSDVPRQLKSIMDII